MFFTYLRRELRRRRKAALVVASGLALGIALVIVVSSVSSGMGKAQDKVLQSLYGLGTDMTVSKVAQQPGVSDAVGGLSLQVIKINGQFTRGEFQQNGNGGGEGGGSGRN